MKNAKKFRTAEEVIRQVRLMGSKKPKGPLPAPLPKELWATGGRDMKDVYKKYGISIGEEVEEETAATPKKEGNPDST